MKYWKGCSFLKHFFSLTKAWRNTIVNILKARFAYQEVWLCFITFLSLKQLFARLRCFCKYLGLPISSHLKYDLQASSPSKTQDVWAFLATQTLFCICVSSWNLYLAHKHVKGAPGITDKFKIAIKTKIHLAVKSQPPIQKHFLFAVLVEVAKAFNLGVQTKL